MASAWLTSLSGRINHDCAAASLAISKLIDEPFVECANGPIERQGVGRCIKVALGKKNDHDEVL